MKITIRYFGMLAEVTGCDEESVDVSVKTVRELLESLYGKYPALEGKDFQVAQNNEIVPMDSTLASGELALLPPFSGG
ncbi:hypothetical protein FUAX_19620 [Fulvitalea axinellae]|uniref:Molybdopterin synthase sulfur carrier subunit n=1 Tax=Fulvitalea axinellae TaxID=1182444 RepID=A0AAU9CJM3_9BACT|nr:hypothetical protein FUAX_19620 [Fulvitalea axinellae]